MGMIIYVHSELTIELWLEYYTSAIICVWIGWGPLGLVWFAKNQ